MYGKPRFSRTYLVVKHSPPSRDGRVWWPAVTDKRRECGDNRGSSRGGHDGDRRLGIQSANDRKVRTRESRNQKSRDNGRESGLFCKRIECQSLTRDGAGPRGGIKKKGAVLASCTGASYGESLRGALRRTRVYCASKVVEGEKSERAGLIRATSPPADGTAREPAFEGQSARPDTSKGEKRRFCPLQEGYLQDLGKSGKLNSIQRRTWPLSRIGNGISEPAIAYARKKPATRRKKCLKRIESVVDQDSRSRSDQTWAC